MNLACRALRTVPALALTALALSMGPLAGSASAVPLPGPIPTSLPGLPGLPVPIPTLPGLPLPTATPTVSGVPVLPGVPTATPTVAPPGEEPTPAPTKAPVAPAKPGTPGAPAQPGDSTTIGANGVGSAAIVWPDAMWGSASGLQLASGSMVAGWPALTGAPMIAGPTMAGPADPLLAATPLIIKPAASSGVDKSLPVVAVGLAVATLAAAAVAHTLARRSPATDESAA